MIGGLAALILSTMSVIQTAEVPHYISLIEVELGGNVTLQCPVSEREDRLFHWYKQSLGRMVQTVATGIFTQQKLSAEFTNPRFNVTEGKAQYFLIITNISKEDEATYFCQKGTAYSQSFVSGVFLAVNDHTQLKSHYLKQSPETESVQLGDSVNLQCSLLSKNEENTDECPGEHRVYWFRSGSGGTHPSIIYTHSEEREERSCFYSLTKTIQSSSDTGTYYCAVVTCGEILFGEGTKVETRQHWDPVVSILSILLALCVIVIAILIFSRN
ncbi:uncharacterized protein LOC121948028 [Plectropomus leopardus]|uniref:uncharacterized protein LOC121948028 n=1 Tax=Plectropomus leopardus TaxID=160734 RepID=UPI001C4B7589|nr:uncharacterized protein LOC121948028 [Plectropomus leopardus]XP_042349200.1 uncharacterized protein LOC121948028 [Plectropomus leopardus]